MLQVRKSRCNLISGKTHRNDNIKNFLSIYLSIYLKIIEYIYISIRRGRG